MLSRHWPSTTIWRPDWTPRWWDPRFPCPSLIGALYMHGRICAPPNMGTADKMDRKWCFGQRRECLRRGQRTHRSWRARARVRGGSAWVAPFRHYLLIAMGTGTAHRWRTLGHLKDPGSNRSDVVVLCCPEGSRVASDRGQPTGGPDDLGEGAQTAMPWSPRATSIASISSVSLGRLPSGITRCGPSRSAQSTD